MTKTIATLLTTVAMAVTAAVVFSAPAPAAALPECKDPEVVKVFGRTAQTSQIWDVDDWLPSTDGRRWCYAYYSGSPQGREAIFTLEWQHEQEGRWLMQIRNVNFLNWDRMSYFRPQLRGGLLCHQHNVPCPHPNGAALRSDGGR